MRPFALLAVGLIAASVTPAGADAGVCPVPGVDDRCELWTAVVNEGGSDVPADLELGAGSLFLSGVTDDGAGRADAFMAAFDPATGQRRWLARDPGPGVTDPWRYRMALDGDLALMTAFVGQGGCSPNPCGDAVVLAFDQATGARRWRTEFDGPVGGHDRWSGIAAAPGGGRVYVVGTSQGTDNDPAFPGIYDPDAMDLVTAAYDTTNGNLLWTSRYDGGYGLDEASAIGVSPDGETVFVTGSSDGPRGFDGDSDFVTIALDAGLHDTAEERHGGEERWVRRYDSEVPKDLVVPWDDAMDLAVSPDGSRIFVTGQLGAYRPSLGTEVFYNPPTDYGTLAYDADDGELRWAARYTGPAGGWNIAYAVGVSPAGDRVFVTGISSGVGWEDTNDRDAATVAYDSATGAQRWEARYVPGYAYGWEIESLGSQTYVAGSSTFFSETLAYSSEGTPAWTAAFTPADSPDRDTVEHRAIAVGGGRVFTASVLYPTGGFGTNAAILAYQA